jgi:hypothetical protein
VAAEEVDDRSPAEAHHDDIKSDVRAAFDKLAGESEETPEPQTAGESEPTPRVDGRTTRPRDEHGRYLPKEEQAAAPKEPPKGRGRQTAQAELEAPEAKVAELPKPPAKADPVESLPAAFKPSMLEAWKTLPREAKEEIHRRETEQTALMAQTKSLRDFAGQIQQAVAPYQALLQAEGGSVATSLSNYLQAATLMRQGSPQAKAAWIAKLTRTFTAQEHLGLLDEALASEFGINGAKAPQGGPAPAYQPQQEFRDPRVDQILAAQQRAQEEALQRGFAEARSEKDAWVAEKNPEFLPWVQNRMATLLETAARDNEELSFDEAYDAACRTHPEVRKILAQREEATRAQATAVQRSKKAAVSIRPQGAVAPARGNEGNSARADIEDAWDAVMGR